MAELAEGPPRTPQILVYLNNICISIFLNVLKHHGLVNFPLTNSFKTIYHIGYIAYIIIIKYRTKSKQSTYFNRTWHPPVAMAMVEPLDWPVEKASSHWLSVSCDYWHISHSMSVIRIRRHRLAFVMKQSTEQHVKQCNWTIWQCFHWCTQKNHSYFVLFFLFGIIMAGAPKKHSYIYVSFFWSKYLWIKKSKLRIYELSKGKLRMRILLA